MKKLSLGDPVFLRNLIAYPIKYDGFDPADNTIPKITTLDEAFDKCEVEIRELEDPDINEVLFDNQGDNPLLVLDGEEMTGALQNRIIASSNLIAARMSRTIPVICAEEGRWGEIGGFATGFCSYPRIRALLTSKKTNTQQVIWREIDRKLTATKTISQSSSMHDIYNNLEDEILRYVEGFQSLDHKTIGFIGVAADRILGCDVFSHPTVYRKFETKLIRSYALDAIEYQKNSRGLIDVAGFLNQVITKLKNRRLGKRENFSVKGLGFSGQGIIHQKQIIHLSAFPN